MSVPNISAQKSLLKGLQVIYKKLFQNAIIWFLDSDSSTLDSVYDESSKKVYTNGKEVLSHFMRTRSKDSDPIKETEEKVTFKFPIQEFLDKDIPFVSNDDLEILRKCLVEFNGQYYYVEEVNPYSMVAGQYLVCEFHCQIADANELEFVVEDSTEDLGESQNV